MRSGGSAVEGNYKRLIYYNAELLFYIVYVTLAKTRECIFASNNLSEVSYLIWLWFKDDSALPHLHMCSTIHCPLLGSQLS